ncbi:MAG: hypothetical protein J0H98_08290 [Solirubrobacterales bacterium]|nr:hypothetical protein [Solirubrobacterales bacterium]
MSEMEKIQRWTLDDASGMWIDEPSGHWIEVPDLVGEIRARMSRCREDYERDPQAYHRGREDELDMLLDLLGAVSTNPEEDED